MRLAFLPTTYTRLDATNVARRCLSSSRPAALEQKSQGCAQVKGDVRSAERAATHTKDTLLYNWEICAAFRLHAVFLKLSQPSRRTPCLDVTFNLNRQHDVRTLVQHTHHTPVHPTLARLSAPDNVLFHHSSSPVVVVDPTLRLTKERLGTDALISQFEIEPSYPPP